MFGVYRVLKDGRRQYVSRTATQSEKLAREIADGLSRGEFVKPDGSLGFCAAFPHVSGPL